MKAYILFKSGERAMGVDVDITNVKFAIDTDCRFIVIGNLIVNMEEVVLIEFGNKG